MNGLSRRCKLTRYTCLSNLVDMRNRVNKAILRLMSPGKQFPNPDPHSEDSTIHNQEIILETQDLSEIVLNTLQIIETKDSDSEIRDIRVYKFSNW